MAHDDTNTLALALVEEQADASIRRIYLADRWYFSVIDVIALLTDTPKPRMYWADMKRRIQDAGFREALSDCRQLKVPAADGKSYETDCADFATMMSLLFALPAWKRSSRRAPHSADPDTGNAGIYAITNLMTQEQYLGSSGDIPTRFIQHRALLRQGKHHAKTLQEAWNRYGAEHFRFEILESVSDTQRLEAIEQQYLSEYKPVYNSAPVASNSAAALPISAGRFRAVLIELYAISGFGKSAPLFRTIRDAIVMSALRPGPNFHLLLEAENSAVQGCEELSALLGNVAVNPEGQSPLHISPR